MDRSEYRRRGFLELAAFVAVCGAITMLRRLSESVWWQAPLLLLGFASIGYLVVRLVRLDRRRLEGR